MKTFKGKIILKDGVTEGYVSVCGGKITYVGQDKPEGEIVGTEGFIAPGFIDIHCHSSMKNNAEDDPGEMADFHLSHGVTTMLMTFYRDIPHDRLMHALEKLKRAAAVKKNIYGAHLEGPYLNTSLGYGKGEKLIPDQNIYGEYIKTGMVKQWTSAPETEGIERFIEKISASNIVPAIGHSRASYEQVKAAYDKGAKIVTHIFDATGTYAPPVYEGTKEMGFDEACMLMDGMYCEVICDGEWIHVKKEKLALLIKTVGIDHVVAITDMSCAGEKDDGRDVCIRDGELHGTKLTMDKVAVNLYKAGYGAEKVFKMTSLNPAMAIGAYDRGEIAAGKKADLILTDESLKFNKVLSTSWERS